MRKMCKIQVMLRNFSSFDRILLAVIILAFFLRIFGITYGLPLPLVDDEQTFTYAALKMLELKTLLPILHPEIFSVILYYPPYLSYLYLVPFVLITGFEYLTWGGEASLFTSHLLSNLSPFFITARLVSIILGTASVFLIYKTAESLFRSRVAALASAFLLATSVVHIALSMVARHWLPASFVFALILYILTRESLNEERRYFWSMIVAGIGMGISMIMPLYLAFVGTWYLTAGNIPLRDLFKSRLLWIGGFLYVGLSLLPFLLHAKSDGITPDMTYEAQKSIASFLMIPFTTFSYTLFSEPVLTLFAILGVVLAYRAHRAFTLSAICFFFVYTVALFFVFRFESRFLLPLTLLYALFGGYVVLWFWESAWGKYFICVLLCIPLFAAVQLSALATIDDTRALAREWAQQHIPAQERILVAARLTRLPASKDAVQELRTIDPNALRRADTADEVLNAPNSYHALNLFTIEKDDFYSTLPAYARKNQYRYLIYSPTFLDGSPEAVAAFEALTKNATLLASWKGLNDDYSIAYSAFRPWSNALFTNEYLGPSIEIYRLND